jgi:hypothetical protein
VYPTQGVNPRDRKISFSISKLSSSARKKNGTPQTAVYRSCLVPTAGLEPARLAPLPPQDSVSTNFTTSAWDLPDRSASGSFTVGTAPPWVRDRVLLLPSWCLRNRLGLRLRGLGRWDCGNIRAGLHRGRRGRRHRNPRRGRWLRRLCRRRLNTFHQPLRRIRLAGVIGQHHTGDEEQCGQRRRSPGQKRGGAAGPEDGRRRTAPESRSGIGPTAVLHQHESHQADRQEEMKNCQYGPHAAYWTPEPAALHIARKSDALSEAPPIRPPSMSALAISSAALSGFMLPP